MSLLALSLIVTLGSSADALMALDAGPLTLRVPGAWKKSMEEGSYRFDAPSEDASFKLDVVPLDSPLAPRLCRDKLVKALGGSGWKKLSVGAAPAATRTLSEASVSDPKLQVETYLYVGCNGKTKWALTFTAAVAGRKRFSALAREVASSVEFVKETPK